MKLAYSDSIEQNWYRDKDGSYNTTYWHNTPECSTYIEFGIYKKPDGYHVLVGGIADPLEAELGVRRLLKDAKAVVAAYIVLLS